MAEQVVGGSGSGLCASLDCGSLSSCILVGEDDEKDACGPLALYAINSFVYLTSVSSALVATGRWRFNLQRTSTSHVHVCMIWSRVLNRPDQSCHALSSRIAKC